MSLEDESTDLKLHTHLCSERYKGMQDQMHNIDQRIDKIEHKIDTLHNTIVEQGKAMRNTLIFAMLTITGSLISIIGVLLNGS